MGLAKVIGWGFLTLVLFGITALMLLGLVFGIMTNWAPIGGHPPSILAAGFWFAYCSMPTTGQQRNSGCVRPIQVREITQVRS